MSRTVTLSREDLDAMQATLDALSRALDEIHLLRARTIGKGDYARGLALYRALASCERAQEQVAAVFR